MRTFPEGFRAHVVATGKLDGAGNAAGGVTVGCQHEPRSDALQVSGLAALVGGSALTAQSVDRGLRRRQDDRVVALDQVEDPLTRAGQPLV